LGLRDRPDPVAQRWPAFTKIADLTRKALFSGGSSPKDAPWQPNA